MRKAYVVEAFTTPFAKQVDRNLRALAADAVRGVLARVNGTPNDIDTVVFANSVEGLLTGQEAIRGQISLADTGLSGIPVINCENACASGSTAFYLAVGTVRAGMADVALAIGAEKLTHRDRGRTFSVFHGGWDVERFGPPDTESRQSAFMSVYADIARDYMSRSGATVADFAQVSVKSHDHGAHNPNAQYRERLTLDQVLESRVIADPLRTLMCSPISDGAAAVIVASEAGLRRFDADPIRILATEMRSGKHDYDGGDNVTTRAARAAYASAGITPQDVDVIELHDASAPAELLTLEELGVAEPGTAPALLRAGETTLGGRIPVNTSGGLLSRGHPIGATGCAQLVELVDQLRHRAGPRQVDNVEVALAENGGGWLGREPATATVTILGR